MDAPQDNFININSFRYEVLNAEENFNNDSWLDPLNEVQNEFQNQPVQSYYKMDRVVFAEPVISQAFEEDNLKDTAVEDMVFIENITVEKRKGRKNKKYHADIDASNPVCPQPNCKKKFSSTTLLKAHIRKVHCSDNAYVCEVCGATFKAQFMLRRHSAVHELRRVQCTVCQVMLSARTNMSQHLRSHSNTRKHECQICHKMFLRKSTLDVHTKFVHRNGDLKCDKCGSRFESRSQFSQHAQTHKQTSPKV